MTMKNNLENNAIKDINKGDFDEAIRQLLYLKKLDTDEADDVLAYSNRVHE